MSIFIYIPDQVELLMVRELRHNNRDKLNFLGGKRRRREEEPLAVAIRTVEYETGGNLSQRVKSSMKKPPLVHFSPSSKYALYLVEVDDDCDICDIDIKCDSLKTPPGVELQRLQWVSRSDLYNENFIRNEVRICY